MKHSLSLQIGPVAFRIGSAWAAPLDALARLYAGYPEPDRICDFTVRLEPESPWRRWVRPSVAIQGDYVLPDAAPMSLAHGLLAAEMGMNLQMALGQKQLSAAARGERREGRTGADPDRRIRCWKVDPGRLARRARLAADGR